MAKRGGLKKKIAIQKIEKKTSRGPCYSKRCNGLFGKASQLCLLSGAQIGVLATPMSENSNVSFFSFGHSSVDGLVSAYLSGKRPLVPSENKKHMRGDMGICLSQKALGLGFWWEDETLTKSQDAKEVSDAIDSMRKLLEDAKKLGSVNNLHLDDHDNKEMIKKQSDPLGKNQEPDQTLNFHPDDCLSKTNDTEIVVLDADDLAAVEGFNNVLDMDIDDVYQLIDFDSTDSVFDKTHQELPEDHLVSHHGTPEPDNKSSTVENLDQTLTTDDSLQNKDTQIMASSQDFCIMSNNNNNVLPVENLDRTLTTPEICCLSLQKTKYSEMMANSQDFCIMDNKALPAPNLDDIDMSDIDSESFLSYDCAFESNQELQEFAANFLTSSDSSLDSMDPSMFFDGNLVLQNRGFNDDHLHFSDVFNDLTPIVTL